MPEAPTDRAPDTWQVEDRTSFYKALSYRPQEDTVTPPPQPNDGSSGLQGEIDAVASGDPRVSLAMRMGALLEGGSLTGVPGVGDNGQSYGPFQIYRQAHPEVSPEQATDPKFATQYMAQSYRDAVEKIPASAWQTNPAAAASYAAYLAEKPARPYGAGAIQGAWQTISQTQASTRSDTAPQAQGMNIPGAGPMPQPEQSTLLSQIGQLPGLSDKQRNALYEASPYIREQLANGVDGGSVITDILGTPDMDTIHAASALLNEPARILQHYTDKAVAPVLDNTVGQIPVIGPTAAKIGEGAVPFAIESKAPGGGQLVTQQLLFQAASTIEDWQQGKIDTKTATLQLAPIVGGVAAGPLLKAMSKAAADAGMAVGDFLKTEQGQALLAKMSEEQGAKNFARPGPISDVGPGGQPPVQGVIPQTPRGAGDIVGNQMAYDQSGLATPRSVTQGVNPDINTTPPYVGGRDIVGDALDRAQARNDLADRQGFFRSGVEPNAPFGGGRDIVGEALQKRTDQLAQVAQEEQYIRQIPSQIEATATRLGARPEDARIIGRMAEQTSLGVLHDEPLLNKSPLSQRVANIISELEGTPVGVTGDIFLNTRDLGGQLGLTRNAWLRDNLDPIVGAIEKDLPNLKYIGDPAKAPHLAELSSGGLPGYAMTHPQEFTGWSKEGRAAVEGLQQRFGGRYALARTLDQTIAKPTTGNYLMRVYERSDSELMKPLVRPRGETPVTQERQFKDEWQAYNAGNRFKQYPLKDVITRAMDATDQAVQDAFLKREMLQRGATRDPIAAKKGGMVPIPHGVFPGDTTGWFMRPEVQNIVARAYEPSGIARNPLVRIPSQVGKGILTFPGDIGGLAVRITELAATNPHNLAAGIINRVLGDPADVYRSSGLSREVSLRGEGIQMGAAGSATEGAANPLKSATSAVWSTTLGQSRGLAYEGNLALKRLLGADISRDTEAGVKARAESRDTVNAFSGASRGAGSLSRAQIESRALLSPQTTRAMAAQFGQAAKLISPTASVSSRINAAATIAAAGSTVWGLGSLINMKYGDGKALPFPVSYSDGKFKYNSNWATPQVGPYHIPILRQQTYINAMAKAFTTLANEARSGDAWDAAKNGDLSGFAPALGNVLAPEAGAALGRLNVEPKAGLAGLGYGFDPNSGVSLGHLSPTQRLIQAVPVPIPASRALETGISSPAAFGLEQILGAYINNPNTKAGLLDRLGLKPDATPQEIYEAGKNNPDAVKEYQQGLADQNTDFGKYQKFVNTAMDGQQTRDDQLKAGKDANGNPYTGQNWRDDYHAMEESLAGARKFAGLAGQSKDPIVQGYDKIFSDHTNPDGSLNDKQGLYDALDQYRAGLSADDQKKLDANIGWSLNQTPLMREYRDTTKDLNDKGFFSAGQTILKQSGVPGDFKSVGEIVNKVVDGLMQAAPPHDPSGDASLRQLITNKVAPKFNKLDQMINLYKLYLVKDDPNLESEAVKFGLIRTKASLLMDLANSQNGE